MLPSGYEDTAQSLLTRFRKVAEEHPQEVRDIDSAFDMFKLGLDVGDLHPSLGQAQACLAIVQKELRHEDGLPDDRGRPTMSRADDILKTIKERITDAQMAVIIARARARRIGRLSVVREEISDAERISDAEDDKAIREAERSLTDLRELTTELAFLAKRSKV